MIARLASSAEFERALRSPPCGRTPHFSLHRVPAASRPGAAELSTGSDGADTPPVDDTPAGAGWVVPKRHARRSVTRQLVKRLMRTALERHARALNGGVWVMRLRAPIDKARFPSASSAALRAELGGELAALMAASMVALTTASPGKSATPIREATPAPARR